MIFPEQYRWQPRLWEKSAPGESGVFRIPARDALGRSLIVVASDGKQAACVVPWEHASVSLEDYPKLCPGWLEMSLVRSLFWAPTDCVMQLHPPAAEHITYGSENLGREVLHLWRPTAATIPMPPRLLV